VRARIGATMTATDPVVRTPPAALLWRRSHPLDETDAVRRHINLFVNTYPIRDRKGLDTALVPGDVVTILPTISGG